MNTNIESFGGNFKDTILKEFTYADNVSIASGYVGIDIVNLFEKEFLRIANNGGSSRLLLGMALYESMSQKKVDVLNSLNDKLLKITEGTNFAELCITSNAKIEKTETKEVTAITAKAEGKKCSICWKINKNGCERHSI